MFSVTVSMIFPSILTNLFMKTMLNFTVTRFMIFLLAGIIQNVNIRQFSKELVFWLLPEVKTRLNPFKPLYLELIDSGWLL